MRVLVAWANDRSANLGVRALAQGSADLLTRVYSGADVEFFDYGSRLAAAPLGTWPSLMKSRLRRSGGIMEWLRGFDLIWDTRSGDSFADIYGLRRLTTMSTVHEFAAQAGVPLIMAPQTIGPFTTARGRAMARRTLRRSALVYARDEESATSAARLGRPVDAVSTDMVFGISQPPPGPSRDVLLNVSGLLWNPNPHVDHREYRSVVTTVIERLLASDRAVTVLPHVLASAAADDDVPVSRELVAHYRGRLGLHVPRDLTDARSAIAGAQLVIGARMHACLNALSTGTPTVALAYSRKFRPLMSALGWHHVVDIDAGPGRVTDAVLDAVADPTLAEAAEAVQTTGQQKIADLAPVISAAVRTP